MTDKRAFAYFDDSKDIVDSFRKTVRRVWHLPHDVLSNSRFGRIDDSTYDEFESEVCKIVENNVERLDCVFLDLDFSGNADIDKTEDENARDLVGFMLGRAIRRLWPQLPIIIVSRYTEKEIIRKGLLFDFDDVREGIALTQLDITSFNGMLDTAKKKRRNVIESVGDIPVSFLTGKHKYFRRAMPRVASERFVFVAMSFDKTVVSDDVWELGIKGALDKVLISAVRVDLDRAAKAIMDKVATYIFDSTFVIADLTGWNANVLYELGLAHASNKDCILMYNGATTGPIPFDVRHLRVIRYDTLSLAGLKTELEAAARLLLEPKPSV